MCADRAHELARAAGLADWDAVVEPSVPEGPALLGFVAARIAEKISGAEAYHAERRTRPTGSPSASASSARFGSSEAVCGAGSRCRRPTTQVRPVRAWPANARHDQGSRSLRPN